MFYNKVFTLYKAASSITSEDDKLNWTKADISGAKSFTFPTYEALIITLWAYLVKSIIEEVPCQSSSKITKASSKALIAI
jgi:hypothetical protein